MKSASVSNNAAHLSGSRGGGGLDSNYVLLNTDWITACGSKTQAALMLNDETCQIVSQPIVSHSSKTCTAVVTGKELLRRSHGKRVKC